MTRALRKVYLMTSKLLPVQYMATNRDGNINNVNEYEVEENGWEK